MKTRLIFLICIFAFALATCAWTRSTNQWEEYQPRTLQSIIDMHHDALEDSSENELFLSSDSFPSKVKLVYLAESRPLPANKRKLLIAWAKSYQQPKAPEVFATEALFKEGANEHWIAVQKPLLDALPKEVRKGQEINAYVIFMGGIKKAGEQKEWLFAMNEFDAP
jgi:hypothetical protein